ncbi:MAG TPA: transposase [Candidatus Hydrogenedentes bacterium]|nr:transposase [Candidatus Hydrogenedentota bacterium]
MSQSLSRIYIHVIFSTKERRPFFPDCHLRREMHAYLASVFANHSSPAFLVGGVEDHVHVLCDFSRTYALSEVIKEVKRVSSIWIKTKGPEFSKFHWQAGYGAFSVSHSNVGRVRAYIMNQEEHHRKISFQDEFRKFLKKHAIEYDERYVWD